MTSPIYWLDDDPDLFPHPDSALNEPNGLLAAGGDLTTRRLLNAYSLGIFPWYSEEDPILWWSPTPRCVINPQIFKPSKSLNKLIIRNTFTVTFNHEFEAVITNCADLRSEGTWINEEIIEAYCRLNVEGFAHSVECRLDGELVGGLYGIALGGVFFGESMFSTVSNSSKVAFAFLCKKLSSWGFQLIDCQVHSPHLESLGAIEIDREDFTRRLNAGLQIQSNPQWYQDS
jgi:leucyl/phenylalanyl-tRNA--protein transferase